MKGLVGYKKIISSIEHLSIINSAQNAIKISVTQNGIIDINELERELSNNANNKILVSIMLANNVTGVIQPIKEIVQIAKKYNAIVHTDVAQGVGKIKVNFENLGSDAITLSAHKFGGIKGCGALI
uniref:Aminotransferase class V domain-containing protein n=1 Tax=Biomphalaria glabrata TaxID=6526 RepID=A0A2C9KWP7_BIOGL